MTRTIPCPDCAPHSSKDCECTRCNRTGQIDQQREAIDQLRETFPVGATVSTVLRHVSSSGMTRCISTLHAEGGEINDVSWLVARAMGTRIDPKHGGVRRTGAGMDMGFDLVYSLSRTLHGDGYALSHRWV